MQRILQQLLVCFTVLSAGSPFVRAQTSSTDSILRFWLAPQTVNSTAPVARTFYFWISPQELDSVVQQNRLLRTSGQNNMFEERYLEELFSLPQDGEEDAMSAHLRSGDRVRVRNAWPNYWSTLTEGGAPESNQLVQVVLMDSSLIVAFDTDAKKKNRWTVFDLKGNLIPMETAMVRKHHIAAVFINGKYKTVMQAGTRPVRYMEYYRTFILCNEKMIKSWHHAVPGLQQKILNDLDYLLLLHSYFSEGWRTAAQGKRGKIARAAWVKPVSQMKMGDYFFATQRFAWMSGPHADANSTRNIIDVLRERWPLQKNMMERFPGR